MHTTAELEATLDLESNLSGEVLWRSYRSCYASPLEGEQLGHHNACLSAMQQP